MKRNVWFIFLLVSVVIYLFFTSQRDAGAVVTSVNPESSDLSRVSFYGQDQNVDSGLMRDVNKRIRASLNKGDDYGLDASDRQEWIDNFPFQPTYSDKDFFIPEKYKFPEDFESESQRDMDHVVRVYRHGFMRYFYENPSRYSPGFEEIYKIMKSEGLDGNPMAIANIFNDMVCYHQARQRDPGAIWKEDDVDYDVIELPDGTRTVGLMTKTKTFSDLADDLHEMVVGKFLIDSLWIDQKKISESEARRIRDRLFNEINSEVFLEYDWPTFAYNTDYEDELQAGDPMMIK